MNHEELRKLAECESSNHRNDGACRLRDALDAITPLLDKLEAIERAMDQLREAVEAYDYDPLVSKSYARVFLAARLLIEETK